MVRLLPGHPEAAEAHQDVGPGVGDVGAGLGEVIGAFPGLQDVQDGLGGVRGVGDVRGRFRRLIRSGHIRPDLQLVSEAARRRPRRRGRRRRPLEATEASESGVTHLDFFYIKT